MRDYKVIQEYLDKYLEEHNLKYITPRDANEVLDKAGILNDSKYRSGLPLRKLLRDHLIPNGYQQDGKGGKWFIYHSQDPILQGKGIFVEKSSSNLSSANMSSKKKINKRNDSDEYYVVSLCNEVLGEAAYQQHTFDFLLGDSGRRLPVDAYYEKLNLVVEYYEVQHTESVPLFDNKMTRSGVSRAEQRRIYDERRLEILPQHGIKVVTISYKDFGETKKIARNHERDLEIVRRILNEHV